MTTHKAIREALDADEYLTVQVAKDDLRALLADLDAKAEALEAYRAARAMPSYGDYAAIPWESKAGSINPEWGGGDCAKHGRWYGRCHCCEAEWMKLREQSDRDAVHARDNALRAADELARAALKGTP